MKIVEHPDFGTDFPFLFSREVQQFFKMTKMIREVDRISDSYASCKTVTSKLEELAAFIFLYLCKNIVRILTEN